jgi:ABC-type bacteriocin/lantibiotic exporter with double-glycine peptidase domain
MKLCKSGLFVRNKLSELQQKIIQSETQLTETEAQFEETKQQLKQLEDTLYTALQEKEGKEKLLNEKDQAFIILEMCWYRRKPILQKSEKKKSNQNRS